MKSRVPSFACRILFFLPLVVESFPLQTRHNTARTNSFPRTPPSVSSSSLSSLSPLSDAAETITSSPSSWMQQTGPSHVFATAVTSMSSTALSSSEVEFDRVANAKEKMEVFRSNLMGGGRLPSMEGLQDNPLLKTLSDSMSSDSLSGIHWKDQIAAWVNAVDGAFGQLDIREIGKLLGFQQNAPWYLLLAAVVWAASERRAGREEAALEFEAQLREAQQKAMEAADAAQVAAEGARLAKSLAAAKKTISSTAQDEAEEKSVTESKDSDIEVAEPTLDGPEMVAAVIEEPEDVPATTTVVVEGETTMMDEKPKSKRSVKGSKKSTKKATEIKSVSETAAKTATKGSKKVVKRVVKKKKKTTNKTSIDESAEIAKVIDIESSTKDNPWASLSKSTLQRKTVKELRAYLEERGIGDIDGKKKADLLEAVRNL